MPIRHFSSLRQKLKLEFFQFSLTAGLMMIDWCYSWCMYQHFAPLLNIDCVYQLTPTPQCAMTNHLCVFVLCEYPCDMDHEFDPI